MRYILFFLSCLFATSLSAYLPEVGEEGLAFTTTKNLLDRSLRVDLLMNLKRRFGITHFVETGTFRGVTAIRAATVFDHVHTIELSEASYNNAKRRLKRNTNITCYHGNSPDVFSKLLPLQGRILFYLDGHYSEGTTAKGESNTPILEELQVICDKGVKDAVILIDDICLFQDSLAKEKNRGSCLEGYPPLNVIVEALLKINSAYKVCFMGDTLLAFPDKMRVTPVTHACTLHWLSIVYKEISEKCLQQADRVIAEVKGSELAELKTYHATYSEFEMEHGFRSFSALWYGLILHQSGQVASAHGLWKKAENHSLPGWRVNAILKTCCR